MKSMIKLEPHPRPWTPHHTHRLYHMSLALCFGFAALSMFGTMATVWMQAEANPLSDSLTVTANVEGVNAGPVTSGSKPTVKPTPTANPTITIVAEPQGQIGAEGSAYVFYTTHPAFSGTSSVPNGLVFITISGTATMNSTAQADAQGKWYWQAPIGLPVGSYTIRVAVFDSLDLTRSGSAEVDFKIRALLQPEPTPSPIPGQTPGQTPSQTPGQTPPPKTPSTPGSPPPVSPPSAPGEPGIPGEPTLPPVVTPAPDVIFGVFLEVLDQYQYVTSGEKVVVAVTLISNTSRPIANQEIRYTITSPSGSLIVDTTDVVSFSKQSRYLKTFSTAPGTPSGDYTIRVISTYEGVTSVVADTFRLVLPVSGGATTIDVKQKPVILWSLLILLWLLFIVLVIIAYRRIRHHTRELKGYSSVLVDRPLSNQQ